MSSAPSTVLLARRRALARRRGRRRRTVALGVVATLALLAGGWWVATGPPARVASVSVSGYQRPDRAVLERTLLLVARSGTVLQPPVDRMRLAATRFPWVEDVVVSRDWPRGLAVVVVEARAAALAVPTSGPRVLVSESGRVLGPAPDPPPALPRVRVPGAAPAVGSRLSGAPVRAALAFSAVLEPQIAGRVRALREEGGALYARLAGGPELRLGLPEDLEAKARALDVVLGQLSAADERAASYIDLSVPTRPAAGGLGATVGGTDDGTEGDGSRTLQESSHG